MKGTYVSFILRLYSFLIWMYGRVRIILPPLDQGNSSRSSGRLERIQHLEVGFDISPLSIVNTMEKSIWKSKLWRYIVLSKRLEIEEPTVDAILQLQGLKEVKLVGYKSDV